MPLTREEMVATLEEIARSGSDVARVLAIRALNELQATSRGYRTKA